MEHVLIWIVAGVVAYYLAARLERRRAKERRLAYLAAKHRDGEVAKALAEGKIWRGMSEEELRDSWGAPASVDRATGEAGDTTTYVYPPETTGDGGRVVLNNGVVVGWERP